MTDLARSLSGRFLRLAQLPALPRYRQEAAEITTLLPPEKPVVIFPPGLDWFGPLFQRPQQLARALARQGALVFYVQPEYARRADRKTPAIAPLEDNLYVCTTPLEAFGELQKPWVHTLTWNARYVQRLPRARLIYDWVDALSAFEGSRARLEQQHRQMLDRAEIVLATALCLFEEARKTRPDALLCSNGVDYEHFASARRGTPPSGLEPVLAAGRPVIGYHGALARWLDYSLVEKVASLRPDLSFVFVGPDFDGSPAQSGLKELPNVFLLGPRPYAEIPAYVAWFDAAMIPFVINDITHATSPLKLFESMASGKPVVVTPMEESMHVEGVLVASGPDEYARKLDEALKLKGDPGYLERIDHVARQNTWDARAAQILQGIQAHHA